MIADPDYEPSPWSMVAEQVAEFEASDGERAGVLPGTEWPIIVLTTLGNKTGKVRKIPLMRVEHDGHYLLVASLGGAPKHPVWYWNLKANPKVKVQDKARVLESTVRELEGTERAEWWVRAVDAYPPYADYQRNTDRVIPLFLT